mmetsp:Transcript_38664/g.106768  ORF Transcript_38664/g.106768 Transcript_38664/m.106768 type:complete len:242 (+) Transcript_38664:3-728(+)
MPRSARRLRTAIDRAPVVETSVLTEASAQRTTPFTSESIVNPASEQKSSHSSLRDAASASGTSTGSSAAGLSRATKSATSFSTTSFRSLKRPRVRSNAAVNAACSAVLSAIVAASVHLERRPQQRDESEHSRWCEHHEERVEPPLRRCPGAPILQPRIAGVATQRPSRRSLLVCQIVCAPVLEAVEDVRHEVCDGRLRPLRPTQVAQHDTTRRRWGSCVELEDYGAISLHRIRPPLLVRRA